MQKILSSKVGYAIFNFFLAFLCIPFALAASGVATIIAYILCFVLILYGIYACFEHGILYGLLCIGLGVIVSRIDSDVVLNWIVLAVSVFIAIFLYGFYQSPNNNLSKLFYRIFPILFVVANLSFVLNTEKLTIFYLISFILWVLGIIFELTNWD